MTCTNFTVSKRGWQHERTYGKGGMAQCSFLSIDGALPVEAPAFKFPMKGRGQHFDAKHVFQRFRRDFLRSFCFSYYPGYGESLPDACSNYDLQCV